MKGNGNYTAAYHKQYYGAKFFISEMHQKFPIFDPTEFRHILQISYPIALIEVEAKEKSREDFSVVERTILKLIDKKVYDPQIIAYVLGLPESYVQKVYRLFQSNKQVDQNGITELGKESLAIDAYVKENTTRQIIQVDAFTGSPISVNEFVDNEKLLDASDTSRDVPHILPVERISSDKIVGVVKSNYRNYVNQGDYSLHVNVMDIGEVVFKEMKYTQAYYLEDLNGGVLMLCNAQGKSVKNKNNKQSWRVVYTNDLTMADKYGFQTPDSYLAEEINQNLLQFRQSLKYTQEHTSINTLEILGRLFEFEWDSTEFDDTERPKLKVNCASFSKIVGGDHLKNDARFVLSNLYSLAKDGHDYYILDGLQGLIVTVVTEDEELLSLAKQYIDKIHEEGNNTVTSSVIECAKKQEMNIIDALKTVLNREEETDDEIEQE